MDGVLEVMCLRHAESENVVGGLSGALPDAALTAHGHRQAVAAARALMPVEHVYASTAKRALQTADAIGQVQGVEVTAMAGLVEVGIGALEGAADTATRSRTAEVLHSWVVDGRLDERVADGETGHTVVRRVLEAFRTIEAEHPGGGAVAVVGHVASLTAELSVMCGLGSAVWGAPLPHAVPFRILLDVQGWHCTAWPGA
ncbi:histidine phosphatase family protein [Actinomadura violacea]|uniref:Histidine phosphatase family protein n=1 Tax=Actinomadura violacea TaxID=2819934 RepID=A0ABS3RSK2_9ACTN|nr:histidine phosphatase family protein [Actinomadura violacea]MBO2459632.1 histidine phosphatase family protein [Actinomadura violacea]